MGEDRAVRLRATPFDTLGRFSWGMIFGLVAGPAYLHEGTARTIFDIAEAAVLLFWVWMLATGIFLLRRIRPAAPG